MCLCRVCRTRVFSCCDNESTDSQLQPLLTSSDMENEREHTKSKGTAPTEDKKKFISANKRE